MTEIHPQLPEQPEPVPDHLAGTSNDASGVWATTREAATGPGQNETAGLVLLINTVLGGLGTLYMTTKSAAITLTSALLVLLIIVVKRRNGRESHPGREDDRSGQ
ncbi:hypothetical protein [Streptomyces mirabilis]|uniref:hypothetical protein n=1 Tax=Streptomyces mirabilis TaxID=68239 RepID=UPI000C1A9602